MSNEPQEEMEVDLSEWSEINVSDNSDTSPTEVEYEIEEPSSVEKEEVHKTKQKNVIDKEEPQNNAPEVEETPEELEGIKTKGAEKRIKQLIRQRKEREEEIEKLRSEVNNLRTSVQTREKELSNSLKTNIDSTSGQLTRS